ncbi:MAG TPA: CDP-diacylglycerol--serine O-phosphatidyltransferase [Bacteroidales bacterium]|nr:CDP-diacylglycerol--serine O-phosphatidyltransferase [Bacteroidales bacterium]
MKLRNYIPNTLTAFNLVCGFLSVTFVLDGDEHGLVLASLMIFLAGLFDFLDGTAARLLQAYSELGKQLDSLADIVSFGVAPGVLMYHLLLVQCTGGCNTLERMHIIPYFALLIPVCSALRLAKFNIDLRQEDSFIGLPTPANAVFFASIPLVIFLQSRIFTLIRLDFLVAFFSNTRVLAILTVFFSYLLVSDFRIFNLKFKTASWQGNQVRFIFLGLSLLLLLIFSVSAIPLIIILYLLLSILFQKKLG